MVLGPAERLHALAVLRARLVDGAGDRRRADEADRSDVRVLEDASTATLSPWTTLKTPSGRPASLSSSAVQTDADGSFSNGRLTNVLPQAIAGTTSTWAPSPGS